MPNSKEYLSLDPGKRTGWAHFVDGKPVVGGIVTLEDDPVKGDELAEFHDWLESPQWSHIGLYIVEDYIIRPASIQGGYQHQWNKGLPLQIIGAIKHVAHRKGATVVLQQAAILPMAARIIGFPYDPNRHVNDMHSAILHGVYFWRKEYGPDATYEAHGSSEDSSESRVRRPARVTQISGYGGLRKSRG